MQNNYAHISLAWHKSLTRYHSNQARYHNTHAHAHTHTHTCTALEKPVRMKENSWDTLVMTDKRRFVLFSTRLQDESHQWRQPGERELREHRHLGLPLSHPLSLSLSISVFVSLWWFLYFVSSTARLISFTFHLAFYKCRILIGSVG